MEAEYELGAEGSFFGLFAKEVVMDNEELEAAIDALDTLHFTVLSLVSSTNRSTRFTLLYYRLFPQQTRQITHEP